ncbi:hypothetical protein [Winogradskyella poriferorum]|uniref:hypothetical protein n=1 Tax=Winogradskyella poriferorum TaxID=307627 RepID=UPI003D647242
MHHRICHYFRWTNFIEPKKTKPAPGQQQRDVRVGWLIADILLFAPGLIVDFATGAIYKR